MKESTQKDYKEDRGAASPVTMREPLNYFLAILSWHNFILFVLQTLPVRHPCCVGLFSRVFEAFAVFGNLFPTFLSLSSMPTNYRSSQSDLQFRFEIFLFIFFSKMETEFFLSGQLDQGNILAFGLLCMTFVTELCPCLHQSRVSWWI